MRPILHAFLTNLEAGFVVFRISSLYCSSFGTCSSAVKPEVRIDAH